MSDFKITGNASPVVGKEEFYTIKSSGLFPGQIQPLASSPFSQQVDWSLYILENGKWIKKEKNNKTGEKASYMFTQISLKRKGIKIVAKRGKEEASLIIKPQRAVDRKIISVELCDALGNKATKPFGYGQTVMARVHCLNLDYCTVHVTLWEDDASGAGHSDTNKNNKAITLPKEIVNGIAEVKFLLQPNFAKMADAIKAKGDKNEGKTHEYYVTAEIFNQRTASSNNINVNRDKVVETPKKKTPAQTKENAKKKVDVWPAILPDVIDFVDSLAKIFTPNEKKAEEKKGDNKKGVCESEARVRAFMRMLRVGEHTEGESGYTTAFNNNKITDLSTHPKKNYGGSTAAGAYQIMRYTYAWLGGSKLEWTGKYFKILEIYEKEHDYIKKYNIADYQPESQDKLCICLMKDKKGIIELITGGKIEEAIRKYGSSIWASLPYKGDNSRYDFDGKPQPATPMKKCLSDYDYFLKQELENKTDLHLKKGFLKEFGYDCCDESEKTTDCSCKKVHIDLTAKIEWQSQFNSQWGDKKAQNVACWLASQQILTNSGLGKTSGYSTGAIQMAKEIKEHTKMSYLPDGLKAGIKYIDEQLEKKYPILVGVNHDLNYRGEKNTDHTTDHFVVIIGRGCDKNGSFYSFYEVGTSHKESGASSENKLYILTDRIEGKTAYSASKLYQIAQVRKNN